jgi:hypothetical protein
MFDVIMDNQIIGKAEVSEYNEKDFEGIETIKPIEFKKEDFNISCTVKELEGLRMFVLMNIRLPMLCHDEYLKSLGGESNE